MSKEPLPITFRYSAASSEYNARVTARTRLMQAWVSTSLLLLAALFSGQVDSLKHYILVSIPLVALIYGLVMTMHDRMMGNLHHFMMICESHHNYSSNRGLELGKWDGVSIPSFHLDIDYRPKLNLRIWLNVAHLIIINIFSGVALYKVRPELYSPELVVFAFLWLCSILLSGFGLMKRHIRIRDTTAAIIKTRDAQQDGADQPTTTLMSEPKGNG